jgi:outer membrane protein assembly factor BamB
MPFAAVSLAPSLDVALAVKRTGEVLRLDMVWQQEDVDIWPQKIYAEPDDVYSFSLAPDAKLLALGHLGPALTVLSVTGELRWRRHPDDHNPTDGKTWAVALSHDGSTMFVGSSGGTRYMLAALDAADGSLKSGIRCAERVLHVACLPAPLSVAAVLTGPHECRLAGFSHDLRQIAWERACGLGEHATALAADPISGLVALGTNTGAVYILDAQSGEVLAQKDDLASTVLALSVTGGRYLAAGLQDGQIAYLEYAPPVEEELLL